MVGRVLRFYV